MIDYFLIAFLSTQSTQPAPSAPKDFEHPIEIHSEKFRVYSQKHQAVWTGHVQAKRDTTDLRCQQLTAYYTEDEKISRLECVGNVEVTDGDRFASGEHADFDNVSGVLVLTGSPQARQGPNRMLGSKVIFSVGKDTLEVENATTFFETSSKKL